MVSEHWSNDAMVSMDRCGLDVIDVIPVSQVSPVSPVRLAHLWVDFRVISVEYVAKVITISRINSQKKLQFKPWHKNYIVSKTRR